MEQNKSKMLPPKNMVVNQRKLITNSENVPIRNLAVVNNLTFTGFHRRQTLKMTSTRAETISKVSSSTATGRWQVLNRAPAPSAKTEEFPKNINTFIDRRQTLKPVPLAKTENIFSKAVNSITTRRQTMKPPSMVQKRTENISKLVVNSTAGCSTSKAGRPHYMWSTESSRSRRRIDEAAVSLDNLNSKKHIIAKGHNEKKVTFEKTSSRNFVQNEKKIEQREEFDLKNGIGSECKINTEVFTISEKESTLLVVQSEEYVNLNPVAYSTDTERSLNDNEGVNPEECNNEVKIGIYPNECNEQEHQEDENEKENVTPVTIVPEYLQNNYILMPPPDFFESDDGDKIIFSPISDDGSTLFFTPQGKYLDNGCEDTPFKGKFLAPGCEHTPFKGKSLAPECEHTPFKGKSLAPGCEQTPFKGKSLAPGCEQTPFKGKSLAPGCEQTPFKGKSLAPGYVAETPVTSLCSNLSRLNIAE